MKEIAIAFVILLPLIAFFATAYLILQWRDFDRRLGQK